ncbi:Mediator of RNA polymerase II transcription subunit 10b [Orobanche gracilis]
MSEDELIWIMAAESLRKHLIEELDHAFPDEVEAYREIRAASAAG